MKIFNWPLDRTKAGTNWINMGGLWMLFALASLYYSINIEHLTVYEAIRKWPVVGILLIVSLIVFPTGILLRNGIKSTFIFFKKEGLGYLAKFLTLIFSTYIVFTFFLLDQPKTTLDIIFSILALIAAFFSFLYLEWFKERSKGS